MRLTLANEEYLGDGLYVSFDGYQFKLRAPREHGDHEVYLEPHMVPKFMSYVQKMLKRDDTPTS